MLAGQHYTVAFDNVSWTNAGGTRDAFYLAPADDRPVVVTGFNLDQISDVGDAEEEMLRLTAIRGHTSVGSGGTAATARGLLPSAPSAAGTYRYNDSTVASGGTTQTLAAWAFNVRIGLPVVLTPEQYIWVTQAQTSLVIRLMAAPADDLTISGTINFIEVA